MGLGENIGAGLRNLTWPKVRDITLFFTGLGLIIQEAQRNGAERPTLLLLYGTMVGVPAFLQRDEKKDHSKDG